MQNLRGSGSQHHIVKATRREGEHQLDTENTQNNMKLVSSSRSRAVAVENIGLGSKEALVVIVRFLQLWVMQI